MSNYITAIHVKNLRHLHDIDIQLSDTERRHLLITGKNGSGKTTLLDAIAQYLETLLTIDSNSTQKALEKYIRHLALVAVARNISIVAGERSEPTMNRMEQKD